MINIFVCPTSNRNYLVCQLISIMFNDIRIIFDEQLEHVCDKDVNVFINMDPLETISNTILIIDEWSLAEDMPAAFVVNKSDVWKKMYDVCNVLKLQLTESYDDTFISSEIIYLPSSCVKIYDIFTEYNRRLFEFNSEQYAIDDIKTPFGDKSLDYVSMTILHTLLLA